MKNLPEALKEAIEAGTVIFIEKYIWIEKVTGYTDNGDITMHNYPYDDAKKRISSPEDDENIRKAIADIYCMTDTTGSRIFTEQGQWYAIYRVLKEYCNYPGKMTDFVSHINQKGWASEEPLCKYESIASISKTLPLLQIKVSLWQQHKCVNDKYAKQCIVAETLMKRLGLI